MPTLSFQSQGQTLQFTLEKKVSRADLYGRTSIHISDPNGTPLSKGAVLPTGAVLPLSAITRTRCDSQGSLTESEETRQDGEVLPIQDSSFKQVRSCEPITEEYLSEFAVSDIYPLTPEDDNLLPGLYLSQFNYRSSAEPSDCVLVIPLTPNEPTFLLVGEKREYGFLAQDTTYDLFDNAEDDDAEDDGGFDFEF
jgi:hypothetical protein